MVGRTNAGGAAFNIIPQTATPAVQDGLWIKSDNVLKFTLRDKITGDGTLISKNAVLTAKNIYSASASVSGIVYTFGGSLDGVAGDYNTIQAYDPTTDVRTTKSATLSSATRGICAITINSIVYLFGGFSSGAKNTIQAYDPSTNVRTTKSATLSVAAYYMGGDIVSNIAYLFGGASNNVIQAYDPSSDVRTTKSATLAASNSTSIAAATVGSIVYLFDAVNSTAIYAYDTVTDTRTTKTATLAALSSHGVCAITIVGIVYILATNSTAIYAYDPPTDTRTTKTATFGASTARASAAAVNGVIYVMGGYYGGVVTDSIRAYQAMTENFDNSTAVICLEAGAGNEALLITDPVMQVHIKEVFLQTVAGLNRVESAVRDGAAWKTIA